MNNVTLFSKINLEIKQYKHSNDKTEKDLLWSSIFSTYAQFTNTACKDDIKPMLQSAKQILGKMRCSLSQKDYKSCLHTLEKTERFYQQILVEEGLNSDPELLHTFLTLPKLYRSNLAAILQKSDVRDLDTIATLIRWAALFSEKKFHVNNEKEPSFFSFDRTGHIIQEAFQVILKAGVDENTKKIFDELYVLLHHLPTTLVFSHAEFSCSLAYALFSWMAMGSFPLFFFNDFYEELADLQERLEKAKELSDSKLLPFFESGAISLYDAVDKIDIIKSLADINFNPGDFGIKCYPRYWSENSIPLIRLYQLFPKEHYPSLLFALEKFGDECMKLLSPFIDWMALQLHETPSRAREFAEIMEETFFLIKDNEIIYKIFSKLKPHNYPDWCELLLQHPQGSIELDTIFSYLDKKKIPFKINGEEAHDDQQSVKESFLKLSPLLPELPFKLGEWLALIGEKIPEDLETLPCKDLLNSFFNLLLNEEPAKAQEMLVKGFSTPYPSILNILIACHNSLEAKGEQAKIEELWNGFDKFDFLNVALLLRFILLKEEELLKVWVNIGFEALLEIFSSHTQLAGQIMERLSSCKNEYFLNLLKNGGIKNKALIVLMDYANELSSSFLEYLKDDQFSMRLLEYTWLPYCSGFTSLSKEKIQLLLDLVEGNMNAFIHLVSNRNRFELLVSQLEALNPIVVSQFIHSLGMINPYSLSFKSKEPHEQWIDSLFDLLEKKELKAFSQAVELSTFFSTSEIKDIMNGTHTYVFRERANTLPISKSSKILFKNNSVERALSVSAAIINEEGRFDAGTAYALYCNKQCPKEIKYVLGVLAACSDFAKRLEEMTVPMLHKKGDIIVRKVLKLNEEALLTDRNLRIALLSALLVPTRQGDIGSCFATSLVIQQESSSFGLYEILNDFVDMLKTGIFKRDNKEIPFLIDEENFEQIMNENHWLNRLREYSMATLGSSSQSYLNTLSRPLTDSMRSKMTEHFLSLFGMDFDFIKEIEKTIKNLFLELVALYYDPLVKMPNPPHDRGAWVWISKETGRPIRTLEEYRHLLISVLQRLSNEFLDNAEVQAYINNKWIPFLQKEESTIQLFQNLLALFKIENRRYDSMLVNPWTRLHLTNDTPWTTFAGGDPHQVYQSYYEISSSPIHEKHLILEIDKLCYQILAYAHNLPAIIKKEVKENKQIRLPLSMPGHALSFMPYELLRHPKEVLLEKLKREAFDWKNTRLSQEYIKNILLKDFPTFDLKGIPIEKQQEINVVVQLFKKEIRDHLEEIVKKGRSFGELYEAVRVVLKSTIPLDFIEDFLMNKLLMVYLNHPPANLKPPKGVLIADTNWEEISRLKIFFHPVTEKLFIIGYDGKQKRYMQVPQQKLQGNWEFPRQFRGVAQMVKLEKS